ncbi:hypothetical protein ACFLRM_04265 [Acidobacteriota bacterium]
MRKIIVILFFASYLLIGLSTYKDYGISWDEKHNCDIGAISYDYVFKENRFLLKSHLQIYGVAFELPLIFIEKLLGLQDLRDIFLMRHLCTFLLFYISVWFFYLLCKDHFGRWEVGLLGSFFLIISPRIYAHSFYNSKDLAFLSMFIICLYSMTRYLGKKTLSRAAIHGFTSAILIDIRLGGVLVPFLTSIFVIWDLIKERAGRQNNKRIISSLIIYLMMTTAFVYLFWPFLWENPVRNFFLSLKSMGMYKQPGQVLYLGDYPWLQNMHWHYIPVWIMITTPLLYSLNFFMGIWTFLKSFFKKPWKIYSKNRERNELIFFLCFFMPLVANMILGAAVFNAWRHMFFIYPVFLLLSLKGLLTIYEWIKLKFRGVLFKWVYAAFVFFISINLLSTIRFMVKNHPFQNIYFNRLAGKNMEIIKNRFELDYWGLSYRKALEYILVNDQAKKIRIHVANAPGYFNSFIISPLVRNRLVYVYQPKDAKYFLTNKTGPKDVYPYKNEFYSVKIGGAKIMVVYQLTRKEKKL